MKVKTAIRTAGLSFAGYAVASFFADKIPLNPIASQLAGFVGAFVGTLMTSRPERTTSPNSNQPPRIGPGQEQAGRRKPQGGARPPTAGAAGA